MTERRYENFRLSVDPHYFGKAEIGKLVPDLESDKNDYYAVIENFVPFSKPVPSKINDNYIEIIPPSRQTNYWRDGIRPITEDIYNAIVGMSDLSAGNMSLMNDINQASSPGFESSSIEGGHLLRLTSVYERDRKLRHQAIAIHGLTCMACGFNFEKVYGEKGKGYIHVHHIKPVSEAGVRAVNPRTDMIVLCANCHSIVHRDRQNTLSLSELKLILRQ